MKQNNQEIRNPEKAPETMGPSGPAREITLIYSCMFAGGLFLMVVLFLMGK
jgi:hypothetical protein